MDIIKNIYNYFKIGNKQFTCLICLDKCELYESYNLNCCKNIAYHKDCLLKTIIYTNKCPICKINLNYKSPSLKLES